MRAQIAFAIGCIASALFADSVLAVQCAKEHTVVIGESCKTIAKKYHTTENAIGKLNPSVHSVCDHLKAGLKLCVSSSVKPNGTKPKGTGLISTTKKKNAVSKSQTKNKVIVTKHITKKTTTKKHTTSKKKSASKAHSTKGHTTSKKNTTSKKHVSTKKHTTKKVAHAASSTTRPIAVPTFDGITFPFFPIPGFPPSTPTTTTTAPATTTTTPTIFNYTDKLTVQITSAKNFCLLLPSSPGGKAANNNTIDIDAVAKSETSAVSFCLEKNEKKAPKARVMPKGFIMSSYYYKNATADYVQISGAINPKAYELSPDDNGGQYDNHGKGAPKNSMCYGYRYYVELIEPNANDFCIRCCSSYEDCNAGRSAYGCRRVVPDGHYN